MMSELESAKHAAERARRGSVAALADLEDQRALMQKLKEEQELMSRFAGQGDDARQKQSMTEAYRAQAQLEQIRPMIKELGSSLQGLLQNATDPSMGTIINPTDSPMSDPTKQLESDAGRILGAAAAPRLPRLSPRGRMANAMMEAERGSPSPPPEGRRAPPVSAGTHAGTWEEDEEEESDEDDDDLKPPRVVSQRQPGGGKRVRPSAVKVQLWDGHAAKPERAFAPEGALQSLMAIAQWAQDPDARITQLMPLLGDAVHAIGQTLNNLQTHAKQVMRRSLEASHEHSKALLTNVVQMLTRDEELRRERSEAACRMLETKMQLIELQKKLTQPILLGAVDGDVLQLDGPRAEEAMNGGGRLTRALHTLTKRMLDAQTAWEEKKNAIEASRADDFSNVLTSLNSVLAAAQGRAPPSTGTTKPLPRTEFLNRGSSVINRQLAQKNPILFPAPPPPGQPGPVGGNIAAGGSSSNQPTPRQAASGTAGQQPTNLGLITSGISSKASLASNDDKRPQPPPARKGVRATGGRTGAHVRSGAGEMAVGFFATQPPPNSQQPAGQPPVGGRVCLTSGPCE